MRTTGQSAMAAMLICAASAASLAQFGSDPANLPAVSNAPGDQTLSKVVPSPDGGFYVCWNDAATGYDVYLQRYNGAGVTQWASPLLVGDRTLIGVSGDYELRVDSAGNAYLAFPQDATNTRLVKVAPSATVIWDSIVSPDQTNKIGARMALLSDGSIAVAWIQGSGFFIQRVSPTGTPSGTPLAVTEAGRSLSLSDLQAGDNGSVIALWIRPLMQSRHLRSQRYDATLTPTWPDVATGNPGMVIYQPAPGEAWPLGGGTYNATQGGSIGNGYFPTFSTDANGNALYWWYENAGPRSAYVQQVSPAGVKRWNTNWGLPITSLNTGSKIGMSAALDAASGSIFASWINTNANQTQWGVSAQKVLPDDALAWGATGTECTPLDGNQEAFIQTVIDGQGGLYACRLEGRASISTSGAVVVTRVDAAGALPWVSGSVEVCTDLSSKGRLWSAPLAGTAVMTFNNASDVLLANIRANASQGLCPADMGSQGGLIGPDGQLNNNDFIAFIDLFFQLDPRADKGQQGGISGADTLFNNNDFVVFIDQFFQPC